MTKKTLASSFFFLVFASTLWSQDAPPIVYAESYRHDATRITEESFEMKLTSEDSSYRELIKDARGHDRFLFTVTPQVLEGRNEIVAWQARLVDPATCHVRQHFLRPRRSRLRNRKTICGGSIPDSTPPFP